MTEAEAFAWTMGALLALVVVIWSASGAVVGCRLSHLRRNSGLVEVVWSAADGLFHVRQSYMVLAPFGASCIGWRPMGEFGSEAEALARAERLQKGDRVIVMLPPQQP